MTSAAVAAPPVVPALVQRAIRARVPPLLRYLPTLVPAGWRYLAWDTGAGSRARESLNIWFSVGGFDCGSSLGCGTNERVIGAGFHIGLDPNCRKQTALAMTRFHLDHVEVAWNTTDQDAQAWRCVIRPGQPTLAISVTGGIAEGSAQGIRKQALSLARIVATAVPLR